jgi:hypothetical protein
MNLPEIECLALFELHESAKDQVDCHPNGDCIRRCKNAIDGRIPMKFRAMLMQVARYVAPVIRIPSDIGAVLLLCSHV